MDAPSDLGRFADQDGLTLMDVNAFLLVVVLGTAILCIPLVFMVHDASTDAIGERLVLLDAAYPTLTLFGTLKVQRGQDRGTVDRVSSAVTNPYKGSDPTVLASGGTVLRYIDPERMTYLTERDWDLRWLSGDPENVRAGGRVEVSIDLSGLELRLAAGIKFTVEVVPMYGGALSVTHVAEAE